jgi:N-acetylmuramoyl-L-alanine amidase
MTHSKHTNEIRLTSQFSSRNGSTVKTILLHHTASTSGRGDGIVRMMGGGSTPTRQVSSNYVVGSDGYIWMVVDEDNRAWTSGSTRDGGKGAAWDRQSITLECVNSTGAPGWAQSEASYTAIVSLCADICERYGINPSRDTFIGHRELWTRHQASYPTACPGGMDIDRIVAGVQAILGNTVAPQPAPTAPISTSQYTVIRGDSLSKIGQKVGVSWQEIAKANNISAPWTIFSNQVLTIPGKATPTPAPVIVAPARKSVDTIAREVLNGEWGNGAERVRRLSAAGYNSTDVQRGVNALLKNPTRPVAPAQPARKSVDTIAREVLNGEWGNGDDRVRRLTAAGFNSTEVQRGVNALLKNPSRPVSAAQPARKSVNTIAR